MLVYWNARLIRECLIVMSKQIDKSQS